MNDSAPTPVQPSLPPSNDALFAGAGPPASGGNGNWLPWIIAMVAVAAAIGLAYLITRSGIRTVSPAASIDPYAAHLTIGDIQLSQAANFAGGQITYVDGTISNHGNRIVTAITVRVLFPNDDGEPPQAEQTLLYLVRTRQPYVDTEPVSAAPLKPDDSKDFRLIFENISPIWNQKIPEVKIQSVATRP